MSWSRFIISAALILSMILLIGASESDCDGVVVHGTFKSVCLEDE